MTTFYFQVEMTKTSGRYWTIGLNLDAETYNEALRIFRAWAFGVEATSPLTPHLCVLSDNATPGRSYFNIDQPKEILAELSASFLDEDSYDSDGDDSSSDDLDKNDDKPNDWRHLPNYKSNDDAPF